MAKGYSLSKGFLFSSDWEPVFRNLSEKEFHALFWELYDFQYSKGKKAIPKHPESPLLDVITALIIPQIRNRLDGAKAHQDDNDTDGSVGGDVGGSVGGDVGGDVGGNAPKLSKENISKVDCELIGAEQSGVDMTVCPRETQENCSAPTAPPPLSDAERSDLVSKGVPDEYINERLQRAEEYALQHKMTVGYVLLKWWGSDRESWGKSRPPRKPAPGELGNSFDTDDLFQSALARPFSERME